MRDAASKWPTRLEWTAAIALTAGAAALHVERMLHAGGLWRDEAAALEAATAPTLAELWERLAFEIMPALSLLVLRAWTSLEWGATDPGLRFLGMLIGMGLLGALWLDGKLLGYRIPFLGLLLLGFSPVVVSWGDSIRPYGLAMLLIVLTIGCTWKALETPRPGWLAAAGGLGILSVQCAYPNAFLVFGAYVSAIAYSLSRGYRRRAAVFLGLGAAAALPFFLYWVPLRRIAEWAVIVQSPKTTYTLVNDLIGTLSSPHPVMLLAWGSAAVLGIGAVLTRIARKTETSGPPPPDPVLFAGLGFLGSAASYAAWLAIGSYLSYPWHFLPLLAASAVYLDTILAGNASAPRKRWIRACAFLLIAGILFPAAWLEARVRSTNADLVAAAVRGHAGAGDVIVVVPWYFSISFQRYYRGATPIYNLPPLGPVNAHRYDLLKRT